jgi:RNA polymerase sigma-70 factor (ECF subfamily)
MDNYLKKLWKESFKVFYQKNSKPLWFYIFKICGEEYLADDIFQESFYRYIKAEPYKLNEHQQRSYLYKIAFRLIIDKKRKIKMEKNIANDFLGEKRNNPHPHLALDMERTFKLLKPKERHLIWLVYVEGYTHKEVAEIMDTKAQSVKVQLFRIRKKFAGILRQRGYKGDE